MSEHKSQPADVASPVSVRSVMLRFVLTGLLTMAIVALAMAWVSRNVGTEQAIADARQISWVSAQGIIEPALTDEVLAMDADALDALDAAVRNNVLRGSLVRVKIWDESGTIVYSDEPRLIGERYAIEDDMQAVFATGEGTAEITDLTSLENRYEVETKLLEVYQLVETAEGTPLVFETYFRYSGVTDVGRLLWGRFAPISIGSLVALQLIQFPFAWRMARRLRAGQEEREGLLRQVIDASEAERRRIASDLHDGVVQDLTGVSLGLAALGRSASIDPTDATQASASIRTSVKSLRSLLVEIYPPNLVDEGLESAVGDLLSGLVGRGIVSDLQIDLGDQPIPADCAGTAYRIVQEALRNVARHSGATAVKVVIAAEHGAINVTVDDNGRGFDAEEIKRRSKEGHLGLRALGGRLSDNGGELSVLSAAATGTRVFARVPLDSEVLT